jgi:hypothetical protein
MGADSSFMGTRMIYYIDHLSHLKLTASAASALERGQWPIRTAEGMYESTGQAYHQFYSPGAHTSIAILFLVVRDLFFGYLLTMILMSTIAFIYSFKLIKYLTLSNLAAVVGAFIFITAPYLSINRVLRAAIPEYMAICILPMVLYYQIRSIISGKFCFILKATLSTAYLFLLHLITAVFFYFFYGLFFLFLLFLILILSNKNKKMFLLKYFYRLKIFIYIGILVSLLDMYYLFPIVFYNDLFMKYIGVKNFPLYYSSHLVPLISIISIRDVIWPTYVSNRSARLQIGFLILTGYITFIYYYFKQYKSLYIWSLIILSSFILYIIINPIIFVGPLKFLDFAQFSYRFFAHFQLIAMIMGSLALITFWRHNKIYLFYQKVNISLILILSSLILVCPYLFPATFIPEYPKSIQENEVLVLNRLPHGNDNYLRVPPNFSNQPLIFPPFNPKDVVMASFIKNSAERIFEFDLSDQVSIFGKSGELYLDVLYYPLLMDIKSSVDGQLIDPGLETYWRLRPGFGAGGFGDSSHKQIGYFHGLKLTGLPNTGKLQVHVNFIGDKIGNWISFITLISILIYYILVNFVFKGKLLNKLFLNKRKIHTI